MAFAKGQSGNPKGKPRGALNKSTLEVRKGLALFADQNADKIQAWLEEIEDPAKRLEIYLRAIEFCVPKLSRQEVTGKDGSDLPFALNIIYRGEPAK